MKRLFSGCGKEKLLYIVRSRELIAHSVVSEENSDALDKISLLDSIIVTDLIYFPDNTFTVRDIMRSPKRVIEITPTKNTCTQKGKRLETIIGFNCPKNTHIANFTVYKKGCLHAIIIIDGVEFRILSRTQSTHVFLRE